MAKTAASKINAVDAQEWLESLQQVGSGWYRQLALAVKAGAHTALGMERKEFAATVGQRLVDPRAAIVELFKEGHSQMAISEILGVSRDMTVSRILAEEGLIEWTPDTAQKALAKGHAVPSGILDADSPEEAGIPDADRLHAEIERLEIQVKAEKKKRQDETKALRDSLSRANQHLLDAAREAREEANKEVTEEERERARKEADAWAASQKVQVLAGLAHLAASGVIVSLGDAAEKMRAMIDQGAISTEALEAIEDAHAGFNEEFNVAKAMLTAGSKR